MAASRAYKAIGTPQLRSRLGRYGGARAVLFCLGGIAGGMGREWGLFLGAATLLWFMLQAVAALMYVRTIPRGNPA